MALPLGQSVRLLFVAVRVGGREAGVADALDRLASSGPAAPALVDRQTEIARPSPSNDEFCREVQDGLGQATWSRSST